MNRTSIATIAYATTLLLLACPSEEGTPGPTTPDTTATADTFEDGHAADAHAGDTAATDTAASHDAAPDAATGDAASDAGVPEDTFVDTSPPFPTDTVGIQVINWISEAPLDGITVTFKPEGEAVMTATTDANGVADFDYTWATGTAALMVYKNGFSLTGYTALDRDKRTGRVTPDGRSIVRLLPNPPVSDEPLIQISGTASGMAAGDGLLKVSVTTFNFLHEGEGSDFGILMLQDKPFHWAASEGPGVDGGFYSQWAAGTNAGGSDNYAMTIDFAADGLTAKSVGGTIAAPGPILGAGAGIYAPVVQVRDAATDLRIGGITAIEDLGTNATFTVEWIEPEFVTKPAVYVRATGDTGATSTILVDGYPTEGAPTIPLPEPVAWVSPENTALKGNLAWSQPASGHIVNVRVQSSMSGLIGTINVGPGATSLPADLLPSELDLVTLGANFVGMSATLVTCKPNTEFLSQCSEVTTSTSLGLSL